MKGRGSRLTGPRGGTETPAHGRGLNISSGPSPWVPRLYSGPCPRDLQTLRSHARSPPRMTHSTPLTVAVVGATGVVGRTMVQVLGERAFPIGELRLLASG